MQHNMTIFEGDSSLFTGNSLPSTNLLIAVVSLSNTYAEEKLAGISAPDAGLEL